MTAEPLNPITRFDRFGFDVDRCSHCHFVLLSRHAQERSVRDLASGYFPQPYIGVCA
jgi:hypothetical protein